MRTTVEELAGKRAKQCFERAEELRAAAGDMRNAQSRVGILRLADNYERMGRGFERTARSLQAPPPEQEKKA